MTLNTDIETLQRLEAARREIGEIADDLITDMNLRRHAPRAYAGRRLNAIKASLKTVQLELGGSNEPTGDTMTTIRPIKILDQHLGWALTAEYDHAAQAHLAWEAMATLARRYNVGVYRHGLSAQPGGTEMGPEGAVYVSAVADDRKGIEIAERVLIEQHKGRPIDLGSEIDRAMMARRVNIMNDHDSAAGRYLIRRPENRGAILTGDGRMLEAPPGQG